MDLGRIAVARRALVRFVSHDLWSPEVYAATRRGIRRVALLGGRTLYLVWAGFARERLRLRAAALTMTTLLSLVPAVAVVFAVFGGFPGLSDARDRLRELIVAQLSITHRESVSAYFEQFMGSVGAIGGVGVVILMVTTVSLLTTIEKSFNDIWGLKADRALVRRFQAYWPLLTLLPILIGVSLTVSASVEASPTYRELIATVPGARLAARVGPLVLTWCSFALMYVVMPNTRVPLRFAFIGGIVAGTLWEIAKVLFGIYAARALTYSTIYGSLAVVPLLILWIYVSWLVALTGALLCFATQNARTYEPNQDEAPRLSLADRERLAVRLLIAVFTRFELGRGASPVAEILGAVPGPPREQRALLDDLADAGLLVRVGNDGFAPGRPAHRTTLGDVVRCLRGRATLGDEGVAPAALRATALIDATLDAREAALGRTSVAQLMAAEPAIEGEPASVGLPSEA